MIDLRGITQIYPGPQGPVEALRGIDLHITPGEVFGIIGRSGAGKSSLVRVINLLNRPTKGEVIVAGRDLTQLNDAQLRAARRDIGMVFQHFNLLSSRTVFDNAALPLELAGMDKAAIRERVNPLLELVGLSALADRYPSQISGGQKQRVGIARALASRPKVLLLDESLSALDLKLRKEMQIELKRLQHETGITFIFVTHDQEEALTMSDRIAVMSKGKVLQVGTPSDIYEAPLNRAVADFIGETNFLEGQADADGVRLADGQRLAATTPGSGAVTLAIRPERTELAADGQLEGVLENIVYVGTDTVYHLNVAGQPGFRVRQQNRDGARCPHSPGAKVRVRIPAAAIRVLAE